MPTAPPCVVTTSTVPSRLMSPVTRRSPAEIDVFVEGIGADHWPPPRLRTAYRFGCPKPPCAADTTSIKPSPSKSTGLHCLRLAPPLIATHGKNVPLPALTWST